jgi:hypothetical protein
VPLPHQRFSDRFGGRPTPEPVKPDEVPDSAKVALNQLVSELRDKALPSLTRMWIAANEELRRIAPEGGVSVGIFRSLILEAQWWEFYEICEALVRVAKDQPHAVGRIEALFAAENLAYEMTDNGIAWRYSSPAKQTVEEAERLLVEASELVAPARQWQKAQEHLSKRPPDYENCVKDAIGALEGVARILTGKTGQTLSKILPDLAGRAGMHKTLETAIDKLYAYRGDEQGVAHGATNKELANLAAEAEMILCWTAGAIVYFTKKYRR